ncbi:glycerophosphodiester phosphodiesterase family protein [Ligilactobacillus acidipiscis]|uniref:Glycerophosphoryl diester phosphodiesterase n=1 Tax=Ligilactobacillus acidipiscis TaxID=89059 RepID=A0A0R2JVF7_9LACO|nr:glycerophosphodiester phosphodiesterase family protein [Ligilactobacillus acidipiscis]KRN81120.1 glycerophosphoryl diester phosphodiesterase [Ligilactobacillus acidipiscis]SFV39817.1 Glycerophosphoryl diester phosphodiesterase [Ligilactobacillus acidipiscis]
MTDHTLIFGHRGAPFDFPENSLAGFKYALAHHIDGLEFDVHLSKDQIPVVIHDETLDRTTNGSGRVHDYTLKQLRNFHLANGEPIPTLKEVLSLLAGQNVYANLEFKTNKIHYPQIEEIVLQMVKETNLVHPMIYSSFDLQTLRNCRQIDPHQNYNFLSSHRIFHPEKTIKKEGLSGLHLKHYQSAGIIQRVWTVNDEHKAKLLLQHGITGIITDDFEKITRLRDQFEKKTQLITN